MVLHFQECGYKSGINGKLDSSPWGVRASRKQWVPSTGSYRGLDRHETMGVPGETATASLEFGAVILILCISECTLPWEERFSRLNQVGNFQRSQ